MIKEELDQQASQQELEAEALKTAVPTVLSCEHNDAEVKKQNNNAL